MGQLTGSSLRKEYEVQQICFRSPCFFNLYAEHIMRNARLDELQAGVKIDWRSIRYAQDTTLTAESKEKLKNLFMSVKGESQKAGLKLNIKIRKN